MCSSTWSPRAHAIVSSQIITCGPIVRCARPAATHALCLSSLAGGGGAARYLLDLSVGLLRQVEGPVADVEEGEDGGKDDAGQDIDLLGPAGELVEPGRQEVLALARFHVDLALVDVVEGREAGDGGFLVEGREAGDGGFLPTTPHHRLLKLCI